MCRAWNGWTCSDNSQEFKVSLEKVSGLSLLAAAAAAAVICDSCSSPSSLSSQHQPHHHLLTISRSVNCPQEPRALVDHTVNRVLAKNRPEEVPIANCHSDEAEIFPQEGTDCNFHIFWSSMSFPPCASLWLFCLLFIPGQLW